MRQLWMVCGVLLPLLLGSSLRIDARTDLQAAQGEQTYNLRVAVDEVVVSFHAADAMGAPIDDLKLNELHLLDNGKVPARILDFQLLQNLPLRAGILLDTSDSMQGHLSLNRRIALEYAQQVLRRKTDQAFVMDFGRTSSVLQPLTNNPAALSEAVSKMAPQGPGGIRGTAVFDAIFRGCLYEFGQAGHAASGNFILLFSDGEDNAGYISLKDAVDTCQRTNTAIYAFRPELQSGEGSTGPATLAELARETGGRVFHDDSAAGIDEGLRSIEADLRNQYRLVYKPAALKHDGSFHRIALEMPERVDSVAIRSGYYAPEHSN